ncbi:serine proteinase stubble-like [Vespula pensylvanica]|uniref:serine proteinase stubble-like n=1 Tax=Vespula pensylvanica TaxID=30213 RepID=UPI001CB9FCC3|nr:serine proteinase stubble-like [Vespula pensylvanica]
MEGRTRYKPRVRVYRAGWQLNAGPEPSLLGELSQRREPTRGRAVVSFVPLRQLRKRAYDRSNRTLHNKICGMQRERAVPPLFATVLVSLAFLGITSVSAETTSNVRPASRSLVFDRQDNELYREEDDAIVVEAAIEGDLSSLSRDGRSILWSGSAERDTCLTSKGEIGRCTTFKECYPYFKIPDLGALDGWVLGVYDTCSFILEDGRTSFGICCSNLNPIATPGMENCDGQNANDQQIEDAKTKEDGEAAEAGTGTNPKPKPTASWPPPIPTHPPDHTIPPLPTHPPYPGLISLSTSKPSTTSSKKPGVPTTWPTKKPTWWPGAPTISTTNKPSSTTSSPIDLSQCGAKNGNQDQERIVGGQNADPGEWPWISALFNAGRQFCGGSLIDNKHVLTAAHCVVNMNSWDVARLTVRLGDYNIKTNSEIRHVERRVKRVVRHRGFNSRTLYNDVAILTLSEPVEFTEQIRPICLPSGSKLYVGMTATVIGWGSLRESGPQPAILQEVSIPVWSNSECKFKYGSAAPGGIVDSFLCAGRAAMDSCSGDSGGPLMVNDGRWTQVGIVSWGIGCGKGQYPGVYTRVTHFLPWIYKNLK